MNRDIVIKLIEQDIKHNQLLNGLNEIGLTDNERYTLDIVWIVADMMGIEKTKLSERWLYLYHSTMLNIPYKLTPKEVHSKAETLLNGLSIF
jgi:hypothetical protein